MPARTVNSRAQRNRINPLVDLPANMQKIFEQAQTSKANHQKNIVALHKLLTEAAEYTGTDEKGDLVFVGEHAFEKELKLALLRVCQEKKGNKPADNVVKFVSAFVKYVNDKAAEEINERGDDDDDDLNQDTTATRSTERLTQFLLEGFGAKDKTVRYRMTQIIAEVISNLGQVDADLYDALRAALLERLTDKEASVRQQAASALCKLCQNENPEDLGEDEVSLSDALIEAMVYDNISEVRQSIIMNLPIDGSFHKTSLACLLERTRDVEEKIRKFVFDRLEKSIMTGGALGPTHPRKLTIAQRELIIKHGLGDRARQVRAAAASLITAWVNAAANETFVKKEEEGDGVDDTEDEVKAGSKELHGMLELLKMLDLGEEVIATDALFNVFSTDTERKFVGSMKFGDDYWRSLTAEKAFLARVFVDYCRSHKSDAVLSRLPDESLPEVGGLAYMIQGICNSLQEELSALEEDTLFGEMDDEERDRRADESFNKECIIAELLKIAVNVDYADEIGRRSMYALVRQMLVNSSLSDKLALLCLDVLRALSVVSENSTRQDKDKTNQISRGEKDFIRIVVEIIQEIRVPGDEDNGEEQAEVDPDTSMDTPVSRTPKPKLRDVMTEEERTRQDKLDMRCLCLCEGVLERVNGTIDNHSSLYGVLTDLIVPSVARPEEEFRDKALVCLSQICLISKRYALNYRPLFVRQIEGQASEEVKLIVWRALFDMFMVYDREVMIDKTSPENLIEQFQALTLRDENTSDEMRTLLCTGMAKLAISGIVADTQVIKCLVISYFASRNTHNHALRQCLAYFLPMYCYSSPGNQRRMKSVFHDILEIIIELRHEFEDEEMTPFPQIVGMLVQWTNPLEVVGGAGDLMLHVELAIDIVSELMSRDSKLEKDDKKALCQLLGSSAIQLPLPDEVDEYQIRTLKIYVDNLINRRAPKDTVSKNALAKFKTALEKKYQKQLEGFSEEEYRKLEEFHDIITVVDQLLLPGEDDDDDTPPPTARKTRKRRSESVVSTTTESEELSRGSRKRGNTKRRRISTSDDEEDFEGDDQSTQRSPSEAPSIPAAPTRVMPKRGATRRPAPEPTLVFDNDYEDQEATPRNPRRNGRSGGRSRAAQEKDDDEDDDDNSETVDEPTPSAARRQKSIEIVPDSEEEEELEVNELLADDDD